ncbi:MAG: DUF6879 family protein [Fimbriimonas sp.]
MSAGTPDFFRSGRRLPGTEFGDVFDSEWDRMSEQFFKYEALNYYDEGKDSAFTAFEAGDYEAFAKKLKEARDEDRPFVESARSRGVSLLRLHAVDLPLSPYLEAEAYSYLLSEQMGESIHFVGNAQVAKVLGFRIPDFVAFDRRLLLAHDYDGVGALRGGWKIDSEETVVAGLTAAEKLLRFAVPFTEWFTPDPRILELLGP